MIRWKFRRRIGSDSKNVWVPNLGGASWVTPWYWMAMCLAFVILCVSSFAQIPEPLLKGLSDEEFQVRQESQEKLLKWSSENTARAIPLLIVEAESDDDPETRERVTNVLRGLSDRDYMSEGSAYLGINMREEALPEAPGQKEGVGIRVVEVMIGSPAEVAGLKGGDLLMSLDGKGWSKAGATAVFADLIAEMKPLSEVVLCVRRGENDDIEIPVRLGKRPVNDLRMARGDLNALDQRAKQAHFLKWMAEMRKISE